MPRLHALALLLLPVLSPAAGEAPATSVEAPQGSALPLSGTVVKADPAARTLTMKHGGAKGLPAGQTVFQVGAGDATLYLPGNQLTGSVFPQGDGWRMETVWPDRPAEQKLADEMNRELRRDTVTRGRKVVRAVGEYIPKVSLLNQDAVMTRWDVNRRDYKVINFIFTRCPEPTKCPASTQRMARLQEEAKASGINRLQLYSVSFDPENDTPGILKEYAVSHNLDTSNFTLLTGDKSVILDLTKQFGIIYYRTESTIEHTMGTLLVNPNGKILHRSEGSRWSVDDFLGRIKADLLIRETEEAALMPKQGAPTPQNPAGSPAAQP